MSSATSWRTSSSVFRPTARLITAVHLPLAGTRRNGATGQPAFGNMPRSMWAYRVESPMPAKLRHAVLRGEGSLGLRGVGGMGDHGGGYPFGFLIALGKCQRFHFVSQEAKGQKALRYNILTGLRLSLFGAMLRSFVRIRCLGLRLPVYVGYGRFRPIPLATAVFFVERVTASSKVACSPASNASRALRKTALGC